MGELIKGREHMARTLIRRKPIRSASLVLSSSHPPPAWSSPTICTIPSCVIHIDWSILASLHRNYRQVTCSATERMHAAT